jgi:hypothetical protein
MRGTIPPLPNTSSWRGAYLSIGTILLTLLVLFIHATRPVNILFDLKTGTITMRWTDIERRVR